MRVIIFILALSFANVASADNSENIIIMFGDSITSTRPHIPQHLNEARTGNINGLNVGPTVMTLQNLLREQKKSVTVLNYGWSGTTSKQGLNRLERVLRDVKNTHSNASIFLAILYGTNDRLIGNLSPTETKSNIEAMISISNKNGVKPVLGALLPRLDFDISSYNASILEAAKKTNTSVVDHYSVWVSNIDLFEDDGYHPTKAGYELIGKTWYDEIFKAEVGRKKTYRF